MARLDFIDASRGGAMMFVLVSHFAQAFFEPSPMQTNVWRVGMVGTPTFLMLNGTLAGLLWRLRRDDFGRIRDHFIDRGLFLLTVAHLLILGAYDGSFRHVFVTDTIAVCMLFGPTLVSWLKPRRRLALAVALYAVSTGLSLNWHPHALLLRTMKELLFGAMQLTVFPHVFPIVPWFAVVLAASTMGERLAELHLLGDWRAMQRFLLKLAASCVLFAGTLATIGWAFNHVIAPTLGLPESLGLWALYSPWQKSPPSLVYLAGYSSVGLLMISTWLLIDARGYTRPVLKTMTKIGQNSLVAFVTQAYVFYVAFRYLRGSLPQSGWLVYLLLGIIVSVLPTFYWYRHQLSRFHIVGYSAVKKRLLRRMRRVEAGWKHAQSA